jgi:hypothetical protein
MSDISLYKDKTLPDEIRKRAQTGVSLWGFTYSRWGIDLEKVTAVSDLCCGGGLGTCIALQLFSRATIEAVDVFDLLLPELKRSKRVRFNQGQMIDVLPTLPKVDIALLWHPGRMHGINPGTIEVLHDHIVSKGVIHISGDSGDLAYYPAWLHKLFPVRLSDDYDNLVLRRE